MTDRRSYIKKAFQRYIDNKSALERMKDELNSLPIPGQSGLDYSKESVAGSGGNGVEGQFAQYVDKRQALIYKITCTEHDIEIVWRTIEYFKVEKKAKGKRHFDYICARWLRGMSFCRAAIECDIPERTASFWVEEIYTVAEAIAEEYDLF
jgi:hypothetical protein